VDLAAHTGLRLDDLLRASWSHIGADAITLTTGKSRHRREVIIPLYDALRRVLDHIPKRSTAILTNSRHRPWTENSFGSAFNGPRSTPGRTAATFTCTTARLQPGYRGPVHPHHSPKVMG
jgi:integrase